MALTKCEECGKEVSSKAGSCPHCGAPVEPQTAMTRRYKTPKALVWAIFLAFACTVIWVLTTTPFESGKQVAQDLKSVATGITSGLPTVGYIKPPEDFLNSFIALEGDGVREMGTIKDFYLNLPMIELDNGQHPVVKGWTRKDNVYTLHFTGKDTTFEVAFTDILGGMGVSPDDKGKIANVEYMSDGKHKDVGPAACQIILLAAAAKSEVR